MRRSIFIFCLFACIGGVASADVTDTGAGFAIPDDDALGASSDIIVAASETISDVEITLTELTHTWVGDLNVNLSGPGCSADIMFRTGQLGGVGAGDSSDLGGSYDFSDDGGDWWAAADAAGGADIIPPGDYAATSVDGAAVSLAGACGGTDTAGTWTLLISDNAGGDLGSLGSWELRITSSGAAAGIVHPTTGTATATTCADTYTDSGGAGGDYSVNEDGVQTICPDAPGFVIADFTAFETEGGFDFLEIFDGPDTLSPSLGVFDGLAGPGTVTSSDGSGCLTFEFLSDSSVTDPGWEATISCDAAPTEGACCTDGPGTESDCIIATEDDCLATGNSALFLGSGTDCSDPAGGDLDCVALAVEMDSMSATVTDHGVLVNWTTAMEIDTVAFRVLREMPIAGTREKAMVEVGTRMAMGNQTVGASYSILDESKDASRATAYYIEDLDVFNRVTLHGPIMIDRGSRQAPASRQR